MRRVLIIGVIALTVLAGVVVNARKQTYAIYGAGATSCGSWVENRRTSKEIDWAFKGQWIMGPARATAS